MPTLREYLNKTLGTPEERLARMSPEDRKTFKREARIRAAVIIAALHRESGKNCHREEGRLDAD